MQAAPPNFSWITRQLAVGGSFAVEYAEHLASEHSVRAVIDLRDEASDDARLMRRHGITLLHLPTPDMCGPTSHDLDRGVEFALAYLVRGDRVLIHCEHGIGRSATLALCVMVSLGEDPLDALRQMKERRALVSPSPAQFACWCAWLDGFRQRHTAGWCVPDFDAFGAIAYSHLHPG